MNPKNISGTFCLYYFWAKQRLIHELGIGLFLRQIPVEIAAGSAKNRGFSYNIHVKAGECLQKLTEENKAALASLNEVLRSLRKSPNFKDKELKDALKTLAEYRYLALYDDYLADNQKAFRKATTLKETATIAPFAEGMNWEQVNEEINLERENYRKWTSGGQRGKCPPMPMSSEI